MKRKTPKNTNLTERAKELRKNATLSEVLFWNKVKRQQFLGLDFYRQRIIGSYIVDFYCPAKKVVIEIDGNSHENKFEYDKARDEYLKSLNLRVIHIKDADIKSALDKVMKALEFELSWLAHLPRQSENHRLPPLPLAEGDLQKRSFIGQ